MKIIVQCYCGHPLELVDNSTNNQSRDITLVARCCRICQEKTEKMNYADGFDKGFTSGKAAGKTLS